MQDCPSVFSPHMNIYFSVCLVLSILNTFQTIIRKITVSQWNRLFFFKFFLGLKKTETKWKIYIRCLDKCLIVFIYKMYLFLLKEINLFEEMKNSVSYICIYKKNTRPKLEFREWLLWLVNLTHATMQKNDFILFKTQSRIYKWKLFVCVFEKVFGFYSESKILPTMKEKKMLMHRKFAFDVCVVVSVYDYLWDAFRQLYGIL